MKELKFRVWDKKEKYFLAGGATGISLAGELIGLGLTGASSIAETEVDVGIFNLIGKNEHPDVRDLVVEQYTGRKDKNGKEIYELVKHKF